MKTYKAMYGEVKEGDFVIVVTNDYIHRSTDTNVGVVGNDGYVYITSYKQYEYEWDEKTQTTVQKERDRKIIRRLIGSVGCPVCKIDRKLISEEEIKNALEAYEYQMKRGNIRRTFKYKVEVVKKVDNKVVNTEYFEGVIKPTSLSKDSSEEDIKEVLLRNIRKHYPSYDRGYIIGDITRYEDYSNKDKNGFASSIIYDASNVTWEEVVQ